MLSVMVPGIRKATELPGELRSRYLLPGALWSYRSGNIGSVFLEELAVQEYAVGLHWLHLLHPVMVQIRSSQTINGLYYLLKGNMCWNPATDNLPVEEGNYQWYYLKRHEQHTVWLEPGIYFLFYFSVPLKTALAMAETYSFVQELQQQKIKVVLPLLNTSTDINEWITTICSCREEQKISRDIYISERLTALHKEYMKDVADKQRQQQWEKRHRFSMEELDRYIELNMAAIDSVIDPLLLSQIAAYFNLASAQLSQLYHFYNEKPLDYYISAYRMTRAMQMVRENKLSISEIAVKTGYSNVTHFSRAFKKHYNNCPSFYRKKCSGKDDKSTC
jgi:YesN/AraC family two-component response regulator